MADASTPCTIDLFGKCESDGLRAPCYPLAMLPDTITPDDLAALLGISTASMRDLAKRGIVIAPVAGSTRRGRAGAATARTFANWRLVAAKTTNAGRQGAPEWPTSGRPQGRIQ